MSLIDEEFEALTAIYSEPGELVLIQKGSDVHNTIIKFELQSKEATQEMSSLSFDIPPEYPQVAPKLSVSMTSVPRDQSLKLKTLLEKEIVALLGTPMLMNLIVIFLEQREDMLKHCSELIESQPKRVPPLHEPVYTTLLRLDHMRNRTRYTKTILKWTCELRLQGRLIFQDRLILILLQGFQCDIKEYLTRQKTVNVDVDSRGRNCKERMLSVLNEQEWKTENHRFEDFKVQEFDSFTDLSDWFSRVGYGNVFKSYVASATSRVKELIDSQ